MPILAFGLLLSLGTFYFDNFIVTNSERQRNEYFSNKFTYDLNGEVTESQQAIKTNPEINEPMQSFAIQNLPIEEMPL